MGFNPLVLDTLNTIQVAASLGPGSFGAYVISQATCASDVLAVMLLQVSKYVIREIYRSRQRESLCKGLGLIGRMIYREMNMRQF